MRIGITVSMALSAIFVPGSAAQAGGRTMVGIDERYTLREEPTTHGAIGTSTAYRISDAVPGRTMEFRKHVLHFGAAIGAHALAHDEVY